MNMPLWLRAGLLALLIGRISAATADAEPAHAAGLKVDERVEIGLGGYYKVGEWTSVRLTVHSESPRTVKLVVEAPDSDDNPATVPGDLVELSVGQPNLIESCFRTGRLHGEVVIRLEDDKERVLWRREMRTEKGERPDLRPALRHEVPLLVTLADLPDLGAARSPAATGTRAPSPAVAIDYVPQVVRVQNFGELPTTPTGLKSADAIVFPTARPSGGKSLLDTLTRAQSDLLHSWVLEGGHLLLSVASEQAAYRASPLADWVPVKIDGPTSFRRLLDLERYSEMNAQLTISGTLPGCRLVLPAGLPDRAVAVRERGLPVIATVPCGFGRVTTITLDLEHASLVHWTGLPVVLKKLLGGANAGQQQKSVATSRQLTHTGITDFATQLQLSVENFPAVPRPSLWWVMGLMIGYLLVIGPLDYLIVHRWLRRPELTWFTFTLFVVLGAGLAVWGATHINDRGLLFNQVDLVDVDTESHSLRGRSWLSIYSPQNRRYEVAVEPAFKAPMNPDSATSAKVPATITWSGVPENSVGGEYRFSGSGLSGRPYDFAAGGTAVNNLPILQWSTKSLSAHWHSAAPDAIVDVRDLKSSGVGNLSGSITHHLPAPLEECLFVVGAWAYVPSVKDAQLAPGVRWQPGGPQSMARDLKALLTGESKKKIQKGKLETELLTTTIPWNQFNREPADLINMLTFHQATGGRDYTGLRNAALRELELTTLMSLGRGILVGRMKLPASDVSIKTNDGQPAKAETRTTFVRLVVPVQFLDRALPTNLSEAKGR